MRAMNVVIMPGGLRASAVTGQIAAVALAGVTPSVTVSLSERPGCMPPYNAGLDANLGPEGSACPVAASTLSGCPRPIGVSFRGVGRRGTFGGHAVGVGRRLVRKTARKAVRRTVRTVTPLPVRKAVHPVRTVRIAATPRPVRQVTRTAWAVQHPIRAARSEIVTTVKGRRRGWRLLGLIGLSSRVQRGRHTPSANRPISFASRPEWPHRPTWSECPPARSPDRPSADRGLLPQSAQQRHHRRISCSHWLPAS
jgi:hypothetical protein